MKVSVADAKNNLSKLIQSVERGEFVTICRHGKPVVDLVPANKAKRVPREFGTLVGKIKFDADAFDPMTDEEVDAFIEGKY